MSFLEQVLIFNIIGDLFFFIFFKYDKRLETNEDKLLCTIGGIFHNAFLSLIFCIGYLFIMMEENAHHIK